MAEVAQRAGGGAPFALPFVPFLFSIHHLDDFL